MNDIMDVTPKMVRLAMARGDTFAFELRLPEVDLSTVRSLYFTVKKKATDPDSAAIFQKSIGNGITQEGDHAYRIRVAPQDTAGIVADKYAYDMQVGINDDIYTLFYGSIMIGQDVTEVSL